ncbi:hypothetical protein C2L80_03425 [Rubneribacter badeniensis]|uniref:Uncharacterized protein n=1 Tax=Rubneribacter badeniensis TaxID=2070688 RepID=A0A2K2U756_9ACTN|nr:hypothetical protein B5F40_11645 [Gordonibacter sp. An230]OUO95794.1 hypothetical protein B5F41_04580 [Gordonibacter sp. An232A]PNV66010.1 hypothetical protein C2L80_03425 [Rubneribacter badeniensis]
MCYSDRGASSQQGLFSVRFGIVDRKEVGRVIRLFDVLSFLFDVPDSKEVKKMGEDMRAAHEKGDGRRMIIVALTALMSFALSILGVIILVFL